MQYIINTTQRVYYSEKEINITLCRILSIIVKKDIRNIALYYNDEKIFKETFTEQEYNVLRNAKHFLSIIEQLPISKYRKEILSILNKNSSYLKTVFNTCL
jgi:hypothetical protein